MMIMAHERVKRIGVNCRCGNRMVKVIPVDVLMSQQQKQPIQVVSQSGITEYCIEIANITVTCDRCNRKITITDGKLVFKQEATVSIPKPEDMFDVIQEATSKEIN